ncbi:hypothetical protein EMIHUDRAFT_457481 [Emiliania huxleyi CCMP1516]|uniref:RRM domain-containing protein n=2 Tax=Emiliania huxleyi TaxID=2903 RepID=A0A0D3JQ35_EMIH1|nr:hypothetical protein EMIHUDRAFT_457481 [Emiliania huxleyi CCMP1516]EOD25620.1 hypothetical protein EMIHUDRAFT_457481 [Emiliania huxleyi CCMP1516]|eukprot:XP_005778049.1 hypothetical protein EMIHUDRAFT_457481 [Emiliania huxleyi CCMP1516]
MSTSEERDSKKERRGEKEKGERGEKEKYAPPHRRRSRSASREKSKKKKERGRSRERKKEKRARKGRSSSGSSPSRSRDKRRGRKERDERSRSRDRSRDRSRRKERGDGEERGDKRPAIASRGLRLDKPGAVILSTVLPHGGSQRYSFLELRSAIERALSLNQQLVMSESRLVIRRGQDWYRPDRQDYEARHSPQEDRGALPPELDELCIPPGLPPNVDGLTILTAAGVDIKTLQRAGVEPRPRAKARRHPARGGHRCPVPGITSREDALKSTKTQRTVYVGGLPSPATSLHDTSLPGEPIVGVDIASGGHFAFLECRTIAEALSFSALNGIEFLGRSIRLGRPRGYTSVGEHLKDTLRMYKVLGNTTISPDGAEPPDSHEERADGSTEPQRPLLTDASGGSAPPQRLLSEVAGLTEPAIPPGATEALALNHMVKEGDLEDADIMGDILEDAHAECQKHGQVHVILCPKPGAAASDEALDAMIQRRLFVLFGSVQAAVACQRELHGKVFEEDPIDATYVPAELLQALQALPSFDGPTSAADAPGADAP